MAPRIPKPLLWTAAAVLAIGLGALIAITAWSEAPASLKRASYEMRARRFHRAAETLTEVLKQEPENLEALVRRGTCYLRTRQHEKARADFEQALRHQPKLPAASLGLAQVLDAEEKYEEALTAAQEVARASPELLAPYAVIGQIHQHLFVREARECVIVCEDDGRNPLAAAAAGEVRHGRFASTEAYWRDWQARDPAAALKSGLKKHLDNAKEYFELAVKNFRIACGETEERPGAGDADTWLQLAALLLGKGDVEGAVRAADKALALPDPDSVRAAMIKADAADAQADRLLREGNAEDDPKKIERAAAATREAIGLLEGVLKKYPKAAFVRDRLAMHYFRAGMFDKADEAARYTVQHAPSANPHYVRGLVHLAEGDYETARTELLSARATMEGDPRFHFSLGLAYCRGGGDTALVQLASDEFRKVIELRPNFVPARLHLAKLYLRGRRHEEAREQCERILAVPGRPPRVDVQVCLMLSEANRGLKKYDQVLPWLDRAVKIEPTESNLVKQFLFVLEQDMEDEALRDIEARLKQAADTPGYACIRGYAYLKKGMLDKAVKSFKKALLLDRQYIMGYVHLARAYEILGRLDDAAEQYDLAIRMVADLKRPPNPALHFGLALLRIKQRQFDRAEEQLLTVIELDHSHAAARLRLAQVELQRRKFQKALKEVRRVIHFAPKSAGARFLAGLVYSACACRSDAEIRAEITERREKQPGLRGVPVTDREIESARRVDWDQAVESYERAIELDPNFRLSYEVAVIYAVQKKYDKMASVCVRALDVSDAAEKPRLLRHLATAYVGSRNFDQAVKAAQEAVDLSLALTRPDPSEVLRNRFALANCLVAQGDFIRARAEIHRAVGAFPGFRTAYFDMIDRLAKFKRAARSEAGTPRVGRHEIVGRELNLGLLFSRAGPVWLAEAERTYTRLLQEDRENVMALWHLSNLYLLTSRLSRSGEPLKNAEEVNRRILRISPRFVLALRNLAMIEELRKRAEADAAGAPEKRIAVLADAIKLYEAAVEADPKFWLPKLELAALYQRAGVNDKAKELYKQVIELHPTQVVALNDYAYLCARERTDLDKAIEYAKRARELSPFNGAVADTLGLLHTMLGEPDAAEQLEQARHLLPNHPVVLYHLAVAHAKTGKKQEARRILDDLIKSEIQFPERPDAIKLREELGED